MALQLKADVNDIPSILKIFGLGGTPPFVPEDSSGIPPLDGSLGGAAQPTAAPDATQGQPTESGPPSPPASTHDESKPPTKLLRLQQALGTDQPAPTPPPLSPDPNVARFVAQSQGQNPDAVPDAGPIAPRSLMSILSTIPAPAVAPPKPTFQEKHPTLSKILGAGLEFAQDAGPGIGAPTFGQGFQAAAAQPGIRAKAALENQKTQAEVEQAKAKTAEIKSHAEDIPVVVNGVTYYIPKDKSAGTVNAMINSGTKKGIADQADATKRLIGLRKQGLKEVDGKQVPLEYEDLSPVEQAHLDLQQSQQEAAAAKAELDRSKNKPDSPAYKAAMGRLQVAAKNAETAAGRLGLAKDTFNANYFGTGPDGQALPGAALTENGTPVGVRVSNVTKPTNATRSKAEQAGVIKQQGEDILKQIDANPDIYGVVAGRWNEFNAGKFGNASQEVRDAYTSLKSFAALQPALHGARGIGMMKEFEDAVGGLGNNPEGLKGSIQSLLRTSTAFQKAGTMKTAPGGAHPAATHVYDPATGVIAPIQK